MRVIAFIASARGARSCKTCVDFAIGAHRAGAAVSLHAPCTIQDMSNREMSGAVALRRLDGGRTLSPRAAGIVRSALCWAALVLAILAIATGTVRHREAAAGFRYETAAVDVGPIAATDVAVHGVLRLPNAALRFQPDPALAAQTSRKAPARAPRPNERTVWFLRDGRPEPVIVELGITDGATTEVRGGDVHDGDLAIVAAKPGPISKLTP